MPGFGTKRSESESQNPRCWGCLVAIAQQWQPDRAQEGGMVRKRALDRLAGSCKSGMARFWLERVMEGRMGRGWQGHSIELTFDLHSERMYARIFPL